MNRASESPAPLSSAAVQQVLRQFDRNHDGKLEPDEIADAHEAVIRQHAHAPKAGGDQSAAGARLLQMFDKNHDGHLDAAERAEARKYVEAQSQAGFGTMRAVLMRRFDRDHDGRIDDEEWAALSPMLRQRLQALLTRLHQLDRDGNGIIDDQEWAAASPAIRRWLDLPAGATPRR